ncbi:hypothetical protein SNE40_000863 [Patella caerulea]|uniref:Ig-like domain-containing protein n=2 Tax=Patella caerulea TaxID=87958 RepID=A0AAN8KHF4_PATCE
MTYILRRLLPSFLQKSKTGAEGRKPAVYIQRCQRSTNVSQNGRRAKMKLGVLGCGRIASLHVPNILSIPGLEISWILDNNADQINSLKENFYLEDVQSYGTSDLDSLLDDNTLNGVVILSSTNTHTDYTCRALKKGKAVFVEKPAGESVEDIELCYSTAQQNNTPLLTGYNRRFDPTFSSLQKSFHAGDIGDPVFIKLTSRDCPRPSLDFLKNCDTSGCSLLSDMGIHDIDTLVWLTKAEQPESVFVQSHAHDKVMNKMGVDDALMMMVKYKSGLIASIDLVRDSVYGYDIRVEIFGSGGMLSGDPQREVSLRTDQAGRCNTSSLLYSFNQRFNQAYRNEIEHFIRCIEGTEQPLITAQESVLTAKIIEKGLESWRNKTVAYF